MRAVLTQQLREVWDGASDCHIPERGFARGIRGIHICPFLDQQFGDTSVTALHRQMQPCSSFPGTSPIG
jgi:hypothetical protein